MVEAMLIKQQARTFGEINNKKPEKGGRKALLRWISNVLRGTCR
jgi:hypothetical protein